MDPEPARRKIAMGLDLDGVYAGSAGFPGPPPAIVIEASGRPEAIPQAFELCARNGRVVLLGSTRGATESVDFYNLVHRKGLSVIGAHELTRPIYESGPGSWTSWDETGLILAMIAAGRLDLSPMMTHEFPADEAAEAFKVLGEGGDAALVLLDWTG
ncbi:MAG: zinc-binding dehydrogenase [Rhodospirillales bacterium]|nr:zinc-binding dehydrogenase [Rhodospirillales bacterium]